MRTIMKTGIVFEGGAFRTIFSCGVMDAFLDRDIMPDYMILRFQTKKKKFTDSFRLP